MRLALQGRPMGRRHSHPLCLGGAHKQTERRAPRATPSLPRRAEFVAESSRAGALPARPRSCSIGRLLAAATLSRSGVRTGPVPEQLRDLISRLWRVIMLYRGLLSTSPTTNHITKLGTREPSSHRPLADSQSDLWSVSLSCSDQKLHRVKFHHLKFQ